MTTTPKKRKPRRKKGSFPNLAGRPPKNGETMVVVNVRLPPSTLEAIDGRRGGMTRSDFLVAAVKRFKPNLVPAPSALDMFE